MIWYWFYWECLYKTDGNLHVKYIPISSNHSHCHSQSREKGLCVPMGHMEIPNSLLTSNSDSSPKIKLSLAARRHSASDFMLRRVQFPPVSASWTLKRCCSKIAVNAAPPLVSYSRGVRLPSLLVTSIQTERIPTVQTYDRISCNR